MGWEEWDKRYIQTVKPLFDAVGGHRQVLGNDVINAIQILKSKNTPITPMKLSEILMDNKRPWEKVLMGNAYTYLEGVIKYYLGWVELPREIRKQINRDRSDYKKKERIA